MADNKIIELEDKIVALNRTVDDIILALKNANVAHILKTGYIEKKQWIQSAADGTVVIDRQDFLYSNLPSNVTDMFHGGSLIIEDIYPLIKQTLSSDTISKIEEIKGEGLLFNKEELSIDGLQMRISLPVCYIGKKCKETSPSSEEILMFSLIIEDSIQNFGAVGHLLLPSKMDLFKFDLSDPGSLMLFYTYMTTENQDLFKIKYNSVIKEA